jgi:glycosyltransferase involved in cell wall biosynthesis
MPSGSILIVNRVGFIGGAERVLLNAGRLARENGFKVVLACPAPSALAGAAIEHGITVEPVAIDRTKATLSPSLLARQVLRLAAGRKRIAELVRSSGFDMIHVHHPVAALYVTKAAQDTGTPVLMHVHETLPVSIPYRYLARMVYPRCRHFVGVSEKSCEMVRAFGGHPDAVSLIYNGVGSGFLRDLEPVPELSGAGPHIGIFGVIEPRKGQDHFIRAAAKVVRVYPQAQFWIVGSLSYASNHSYLERLRQLVSELSIGRSVHFTDHQDDVPRWMAGMDAVVLASTGSESLPTVIIEACALGRPVVATSVGGVAEIVHHGETGRIVPPADADAIASALTAILSGDGRAMAAKAKADVRERFSRERFETEMMKCYRRLLAERLG